MNEVTAAPLSGGIVGSSWKYAIKSGLKRLFSLLGYSLVRKSSPQPPATMARALRTMIDRKHSFRTVIDVGASDGRWSASLLEHFPQCQYLLIEAQPVHRQPLQRFCHLHSNANFILAAAGATTGKIYFEASDPFGGQASPVPYPTNCIQVPVVTIDDEIQARQLAGPFLLKLDTHGFEVPILKGALTTLQETEMIVMECYNFKIAPECLLFFEMCEYLRGFGFRCIDLVDPLYRPYDDSFWQMDLFFVRDNRPEFSYLHYR